MQRKVPPGVYATYSKDVKSLFYGNAGGTGSFARTLESVLKWEKRWIFA